MGQNILMLVRVVSCGSDQSHEGNSNLMLDRLQGVQDRMDRRNTIYFLKFSKSQIMLKGSEYFSIYFKRLLDCQKVQDNFPEV